MKNIYFFIWPKRNILKNCRQTRPHFSVMSDTIIQCTQTVPQNPSNPS